MLQLDIMAPGLNEDVKQQVMGMLRAGRSVRESAKAMGITPETVYRIRKRYHERGGDLSRKKGQGRKASKVVQRTIDIVRKRAERDPRRSMRKMAKEFNMSPKSMRAVVHAAGFKSMPPLLQFDIMPGQEIRRLERAMWLLEWRTLGQNKDKIILWSDEKIFYVEACVNKKTDRFLVPLKCSDPTLRIVKRRKNPISVMVFAAVASNGAVMDPIIFPPNTTVNSITYRDLVLIKVKEFINGRFEPGSVIFQQNGAPAHTSKVTQRWLEENLGSEGYWPKDWWPPSR